MAESSLQARASLVGKHAERVARRFFLIPCSEDDMARELKVIQDFYDFVLWLIRHIEKFPRHHRYSLGRDIEGRLQGILAMLLRAKFSGDKAELLFDANIELEVLRFQVRLAKDLDILAAKSHGHAAEVMHKIGSQIGGWAASRGCRQ